MKLSHFLSIFMIFIFFNMYTYNTFFIGWSKSNKYEEQKIKNCFSVFYDHSKKYLISLLLEINF